MVVFKMIYWLHFLIVLVLYIIFGRNNQTKNIFIITSFIYSVFVFGQRWMTGTDFPNYLRYYVQDYTRNEWGYFSLQSFVRDNNLYFGIIIFAIFLFTQINFYRFFTKFQYDGMLIFIFLISEIFFAQMSQIRQYVAISFFINSYYHSYKDEKIKSLINLILSYSFHTSALFFVPLLFIKLPFNQKKLGMILTTFFILPFIDVHVIFKLPFLSRYSHYVGGYFDVPLSFNHAIKYYTVLLILVFFSSWAYKLKSSRNNLLIYNGIFYYMLIYGLSFHFAPLFRVATFFQVFEIIFLVILANNLKNIPEYLSKKVIALLFIGIFSMSALVDAYTVANYDFRFLRFYDNRSHEELVIEADNFTQ